MELRQSNGAYRWLAVKERRSGQRVDCGVTTYVGDIGRERVMRCQGGDQAMYRVGAQGPERHG